MVRDSRLTLRPLLRLVGLGALAGVFLAGSLVPAVGLVGGTAQRTLNGFQSLPLNLRTPNLAQQTQILDADGNVFATLFYQNRINVRLKDVAPVMRDAIVAIEDERFYKHPGVDVRGTVRSIVSTLSGRQVQGGSTITQQFVRQTLIATAATPADAAAATVRTPSRKLREMRYALSLEKKWTKQQILEGYLNIAYFGAGAYGIEAASRRYFSKKASELTLPEAAMLAGLVQQPVGYDPTRNPEAAQQRRATVLSRMVRNGFISQRDADAANAQRVIDLLKPSSIPNGCTGSAAPFFCDYVMQTIRTDVAFGATLAERDALLRRGGLKIRTTLSTRAQNAAQAAVDKAIPRTDPSKKAAAITMVEPGTGRIVAMAQNRLWGTSGDGVTTYNYNAPMAYGGTRGMQAGSTFKIFVLAAALEKGIPADLVIDSPPQKTFTNFYGCGPNATSLFPPYTVNNSTHSGRMNMYSGTAQSVNTYFMALEEKTGVCRPTEIAASMGVTRADGSPLEAVPSFVLGANEIAPVMLANAMATFAAHGKYCPTSAVISVTRADGTVIPVPPVVCKQVIARGVADGVTVMLRDVIDGSDPRRTGGAMHLSRPAAGKTGTTNTSAAVWFAGYVPQLAAASWVGDPRGGYKYPMKNITINGTKYEQVFGASIPGPIWKASMRGALVGVPIKQFDLKPVINGELAAENPVQCAPNDYVCLAGLSTPSASAVPTPSVP